MGETGLVRFPGNLDPRAQEFRPRNPVNNQTQLITLFRPPQLYYPYAPPLPPYPSNDVHVQVQVLPFCEVGAGAGGGGGGVGYAHYTPHPAYVSATAHLPLPPPSAAPTRTLVLSSVASDVSESIVRRDLEVFGEVRGVQMERVLDGIVTVHFYDLRHAEKALKEIREQHMQHQTRLRNHYCALMVQNSGCEVESLSSSSCSSAAPLPPPARGLVAGRAVWAQFIIPASNVVPEGNNQGTIVAFNLDSGVSSSTLKELFQAFGAVKELRETPLKKHQRFIEFYDIRDAAKALKEMNGKEIYGKPVVIEFSRPGGYTKKFFNAHHPNTAISIMNSTNTSHHFVNSDYNPTQAQPSSPPPSFPCNSNNFSSTRSPSSFSHSLLSQSPTQPFKKKPPPSSSSSTKGNPSVINGHNTTTCSTSIEATVSALSLAEDNVVAVPVNGNPRRSFKKTQNNQSAVVASTKQQVKNKNRLWKGRQAKKFDARFLINGDAMVDSNCKDSRTTVMIKNIPNKYSQKLLLNMLDNHCIHCNEQIADGDDQPLSSFDFVYLPIDFNNKCNVGYGFVNMTSPEATLRLYKAFHLQNWEVFNSRKICEVTYARVQGLEALKEHFKNSKFPCEMDHYLPVVFSPPRDGRQLTEPLPIVGLAQNRQHHHQSINIGGQSLTTSHHDDDDDDLDGADTLDNANDSDYAADPNGGDLGDDDDVDEEDINSGSSSSGVVVLV
ncbi:hypothetical protein ACOSP7_018544 [Xanthoceras sorbifolium]